MPSENIFSALAKYNSATDENYLTEAFVFVINSLLEREQPIGLEILTQLCVENNAFSFNADEVISVSTQQATEQGTPDIKVWSPSKLIYIEVKDSSPVDPGQLKRYKKDLESSSAIIKKLILLTRYPVDLREHQGIPDKHVYWREVYKWLENIKAKDPVSVYLIEQFKYFLEEKQMSIQKVGWEYINGVPAFNNLLNMIEAAIQATAIPFYRTYPRPAARESKGFYLENSELWCGIYYENHLDVVFEIQHHKEKFNTKLIKKPLYPLEEFKGMWGFHLHLEDIHFFSLDKDKQLEEITKFVKTTYAEAQQMRIKEQ